MTSSDRANVSRIPRQLLLLWICLVAIQCSFSQAPPTFTQALSDRRIGLTKPALIEALSHPDKEIRGLAAAELSELKATDALPEIMGAARIETDAQTQVNIVAAAVWMGSSEGLDMLTSICQDPAVRSYVRQDAARHVFDKGVHACFSSIADMMLPSEDTDTRIGAMYLLSQLKDRTNDESNRVLQLLLPALADSEPRLRMEVCQAIRWLKDPRAITSLRSAITTESDQFVREQMQKTLDSLIKPPS
jgi:HEAT repeat protein